MHSKLLRAAFAAGWPVVGFLAWGPAYASAANLVGIDFNGSYWDVNKSTGTASNPRATGVSSALDIAASPGGQLFTAEATTQTGGRVFRLNSTTGASTLVGPTGLGSLIEGGLTFSPSGTLYGAWFLSGASGSNNNLVTLNTTTGAGTVIGPMVGGDDISAMVYTASGTLYAIDSRVNAGGSARLYTLNPATGAILTTTLLSQSFNPGQTMGAAIDPDTGTFYVASNGPDLLYTLNPTTGVLTTVGSLGSLTEVSGLAFIPEPATLGLLGVGFVIACRRSRAHAPSRVTIL